jgi:hypothetical protein
MVASAPFLGYELVASDEEILARGVFSLYGFFGGGGNYDKNYDYMGRGPEVAAQKHTTRHTRKILYSKVFNPVCVSVS